MIHQSLASLHSVAACLHAACFFHAHLQDYLTFTLKIILVSQHQYITSLQPGELRTESNCLSVLELGPGLGALTRSLAELYPTNLLAVDVDPRAVAVLQKDLPNLKVRLQDLLTLNHAEAELPMGSLGWFCR